MNMERNPVKAVEHTLESMTQDAADQIDTSLAQGQRAAHQALEAMRGKVSELRSSATETLGKASELANDLARSSVDKARHLKADLQVGATRAGDRTVGYIQDQPLKSVLIAGAVGAALALWLSRRPPQR